MLPGEDRTEPLLGIGETVSVLVCCLKVTEALRAALIVNAQVVPEPAVEQSPPQASTS